MIAIIGFVIVSAAVIGGYLLEGGNLSVIFQPVEILTVSYTHLTLPTIYHV